MRIESIFYVIAIVTFVTIHEIFTKEVNCRKFDIKNEGQRDSGRGEVVGLAPWRLFNQNFSYQATQMYANGN